MVRLVDSNDWFWEELRREVGDGLSTKFWTDPWIRKGVCLSEKFPRLFRLESNKNCLVRERLEFRGLEAKVTWSWRREPFVWEIDLFSELGLFFSRCSPFSSNPDCWRWLGGKAEQYTTSDGYRLKAELLKLIKLWTGRNWFGSSIFH